MIAAVLLAACLNPPFQDPDIQTSTNICTTANQEIECQCSECIIWDPVADTSWYDIHRIDQDGTVHSVIGTSKVLESFTDDDGVFHPKIPLHWYCFAFDESTPMEGRRYRYSVRSCSVTRTTTCGPWSSEVVYIGAPITCYDGGVKVDCPRL